MRRATSGPTTVRCSGPSLSWRSMALEVDFRLRAACLRGMSRLGGILTRLSLPTFPAQTRNPSCPKTQTNSRLARRAVSIVIDPWRAPDLGRVGGDVGDSGSPYAQGKHRPATGCHAPGRRPGSRPRPHLDQNVLAGAVVALALILDSSGGLFSDAARPCQRPAPPTLAQTWHSKIEIRDENRK